MDGEKVRVAVSDLPDLPILDLEDEEAEILSIQNQIGSLAIDFWFVPAGKSFIRTGNFFQKAEDLLFAFGGRG